MERDGEQPERGWIDDDDDDEMRPLPDWITPEMIGQGFRNLWPYVIAQHRYADVAPVNWDADGREVRTDPWAVPLPGDMEVFASRIWDEQTGQFKEGMRCYACRRLGARRITAWPELGLAPGYLVAVHPECEPKPRREESQNGS